MKELASLRTSRGGWTQLGAFSNMPKFEVMKLS